MPSAITKLDDAKAAIEELAKRVKSARLTRPELMATLSRIYAIRLSVSDQRELLDFVIAARKFEGANRAFLLRQNNEYMLPLRYVFPSVEDRSNVSRYAGALRELRRLQIPEHQFHQAVKAHGGLVDLYWNGRTRETKRQILHLLPQASGVFRVLSVTNAEPIEDAA